MILNYFKIKEEKHKTPKRCPKLQANVCVLHIT